VQEHIPKFMIKTTLRLKSRSRQVNPKKDEYMPFQVVVL